jgi:hypothetical protein
MVVVNDNPDSQEIDLNKFSEQLKGTKIVKEMLHGITYNYDEIKSIKIDRLSANLFQLIK